MTRKKKAEKVLTPEEKLEQALVPEEEWPYVIPENWCWTRIGSVTKVVGGGTPSSNVAEYYENGTIPWISPADLSEYHDIYIFSGAKNITELGFEKSSAKMIPKNTVCLSSRAPIGYVVIAGNPLCTNQGFKSFLPSFCFLPKYLYWYLKGNKELLESYASGTTFLELSGKKIGLVEFPLAPLPEQQRIVDRIESLFSKLDEAKEKVQAVIDSSEQRKSAILHKAFTGKLTEKWRKIHGVGIDSWEKIPFSNLILDGPQNGLYKPKTAYGSGIKILRIDSFYDGDIKTWEKLKRLILSEEEIQLYKLHLGEIVINRVNSMPYLGKSALVRDLPETCVFESNMMRIALNKELVAPEFIIRYLNSPIGLTELRKNAKQAVNQASINQQDVKNVIVKLPSLEEQFEIICILKNLNKKEQQAKETAKTVLDQIDIMKKSILAKAFRGKLGTNDPSDESAIELLKKKII